MSSDDFSCFSELDLIADEFATRFRRGERPSVKEYEERYPHLAAELREVLPAMVHLERVKGDLSQVRDPGRLDPPPNQAPKLKDYRILREIGHGGMGLVYEAEQISLGRRVAVKVLNHSAWRSPDRRLRFAREAKAAARLHHTNIVPVFGVGEENGCPFYVMQFIQGRGLDEVIKELVRQQTPGEDQTVIPQHADDVEQSAAKLAESLLHSGFAPQQTTLSDIHAAGSQDKNNPDSAPQPEVNGAVAPEPAPPQTFQPQNTPQQQGLDPHRLSSSSGILSGSSSGGQRTATSSNYSYWQRVAQIGMQVADALDYAHKAGVLHRDIKPSNLLLDLSGTVWVTDFGLAKTNDQDALTQTGDILGTLRYLPPEAFSGRADGRSDIYSLGLTLYELLALRPAFDERDRSSLLKRVTESNITRIDTLNPAVPRDLATIVTKATQREPRDRYPSAADFKADLQRYLNDEPILARRSSTFEYLLRVARRHPGTSVSISVIAVMLVLVFIASIIAARFYRAMAQDQLLLVEQKEAEREKAEQATESAKVAEARAISSQRQTELTLYDLYTTMGLHSEKENRPAQGASWFVEAVAITEHAPDRAALARLRFQNWTHQLPRVIRAWRTSYPLGSTATFNPAGDQVLVTTPAPSVAVWNLVQNRVIESSQGNRLWVAGTWGPLGDWLALGRKDGVVEIVDAETLKPVTEFTAFSGPVNSLAFSPDGKWLAICGDHVRLYQCDTRQLVADSIIHSAPVLHATFGYASRYLLTHAMDQQARLFEFKEGQGLPELRWTQPHHSQLGLYPQLANIDSQFITWTQDNGTLLRVWSSEQGSLLYSLNVPTTIVSGMADPASNLILIPSHQTDFGTELLNTADGTFVGQPLKHENFIKSCCLRPDLSRIVTSSIDRTVKIWKSPECEQIFPPLYHQDELAYATLSSDGRRLLSIQGDGLMKVWQMPEDNAAIRTLGEGPWGELTPDGRYYLPSGTTGGRYVKSLRVYDTASGLATGTPLAYKGVINAASIAPSGKEVVTGTALADLPAGEHAWDASARSPGQIRIRKIDSGADIISPLQSPSEPIGVNYSPDGQHIGVVCAAGEIWLLNAKSGEIVREYRQRPSQYSPTFLTGRQICFCPDGKSFATWLGASVSLWRLDSSQSLTQQLLLSGNVHDVVYSRDGKLVAICGSDKIAQIYHSSTGELAAPPLQHPDWVFSASFSHDGNQLATACRDHTVRIWDLRTGNVIASMQHQDEVFGVAFSRTGRWLVSSGRDFKVRIWDAVTALPLSLPIHTGYHAYRVHLTPDEKYAVVSTARQQFPIINLEPLTELQKPLSDLGELRLQADLHAGQTLTHGSPNNLTSTEWYEKWQRLNGNHGSNPLPALQVRTLALEQAWPVARRRRHQGDLMGAAEIVKQLLHSSDPDWVIRTLACDPTPWSEVLEELVRQCSGALQAQRWLVSYEQARGNWKGAAIALASVAELEPDVYQNWYELATLQVAVNDKPGYQATCRTLLQNFADKAANRAAGCEQISKSCLLMPDAIDDQQRVYQLALRADELAGENSTDFWIIVNRAFAHYRQGEFEAAEAQAERTLKVQGIQGSPMYAQALAIKALSQLKRGKVDEVAQLLELAKTWLTTNRPNPAQGRAYDINWSDWLRGEIVVQEAVKVFTESK